MNEKKTRQEAIDELTLMLLYLTRFPDREGKRYDEISWKNYDFDAIDRLDEQDLIYSPKRRTGGGYKYAYLTENGRAKARELLHEMNIADDDVIERFEFRYIKQEEAEEAVDVEAVCFPPNEACSKQHMIERINAAPDLFLVAIDRVTGKMAGFLNGIATNERAFRDEFFIDAGTHDPNGLNIMLLGLDVLPEYRKRGLAKELVWRYCRTEEVRGRQRLVLTCHGSKVKMYKKLGFRDLGDSASEWGGMKWHEMDVILNL